MSLNSISKTALSNQLYPEISRSTIPGFTPIIKFGESENVGNTLETIWEEGGLYQYPAAAAKLTISSDNVNDVNTTGTGAWKVNLVGLDVDFNWIQEFVNLDGQNGVETQYEYLRVNELFVISANPAGPGWSAGNIYAGTGIVSSGKPAVVLSKINGTVDHDNRALCSPFTIPKGYKGSIKGLTLNTGKGKEGKAGIYVRPFGGVFQAIGKLFSFESSIFIPFEILPTFSAGSDIEIRGREIVTATGIEILSGYTMILERKFEIDPSDQAQIPFIIPGLYNTSLTWDV